MSLVLYVSNKLKKICYIKGVLFVAKLFKEKDLEIKIKYVINANNKNKKKNKN